MKKALPLLIILGVLIFWGISINNGLVEKRETVNQAWSNVESQYQRRADLIPNLVNTVKGYAEHEQETFVRVTEARKQVTNMNIDANNLTPEKMQEFQAKQNTLRGALSRLLLVQERYPDLKANTNFLKLQDELSGTENRINESRRDYNNIVRPYNTSLKKFPRSVFANILGFDEAPYFQAKEGSDVAPEVQF